MPDPVAPPADPPVAPPEPPVAPTSMVGEDGNFIKDWQMQLSDETLHEDKTLQTFKNVEGLAKSYVHVRKQVPLDKIAIPNENTTDAEWDNWHTAGGRPPTAVDYNIARPEDFPEEHWSNEIALAAQDLFHKIGLNPKQVTAISEFNNANILTALKTQSDAIVAFRQNSKNELMQEEGNAFEQRRHIGNWALENKGINGNQELKVRWLNTPLKDGGVIGDLADTSRIFSNFGEKFAEHGDIVASHIQTPGDIQAEIDKEMQTEAYKSGRHPGHKAAVIKVSRLFQEKSKVTPTGR